MTAFERSPDPKAMTQALRSLAEGNRSVDATLITNLLNGLRAIASGHLKDRRSKQAFEPTALVNEAYLKLFGGSGAGQWNDRGHFFRVASAAMRTILVDDARVRNAKKRPPASKRIEFDQVIAEFEAHSTDLLDMDFALKKLEENDSRAAKVFQMRYFGGMKPGEIGEALGVASRTINRDLSFARAFIRREIGEDDRRTEPEA